MFLGVFFQAKKIEMSFCPGSSGFGFASLQFFFGPSPVSLFMKLSMPDVSVSWLTGGQNKLSARTGLSCEERVAGGGSAWSVKRFGLLCASMESVNSGGGEGMWRAGGEE